MVITLLSAALFLGAAGYIWWRIKQFSILKQIGVPGPQPNVISGNLPEIGKKGIIVTFKEWTDKYGDTVGFYNGRLPMILTKDLNLIKQVQISKFSDCSSRGLVSLLSLHHPFRRFHIFNAMGQRWRNIRGVCTRTYNSTYIRKMANLLECCTDEFVDGLASVADTGKAIDIIPICRTFSAGTMLRTGFSFKMDSSDTVGKSIMECVVKLTLRNISVFQGDWTHWLSNCFPEFGGLVQLVLSLMEYFKKPGICELRDALLPIIQCRKEEGKSERRRFDLLQFLLDAHVESDSNNPSAPDLTDVHNNNKGEEKTHVKTQTSSLSPVEIECNASLVVTAGTVNLSKYLSWMMYLLAKHQDAQDKVREEVMAILNEGGTLDYAAIPKLQYTDQAFSESLRVQSSPAGFVTRLIEKDIDCDGLKIPKGVSVLIPTYLLHHDPEIWENPERFDPERFSPENSASVDSSAFQPFGSGPRNCFAMTFSKVVIKLLVAKIMSRYTVELDHERMKEDISTEDMEDILLHGYVKRGYCLMFKKIESMRSMRM